MLPEIKLYDSNFAHATSCSNGDLKIYPQYFKWYRGGEDREIAVFVDGQAAFAKNSKAKTKIWMLMEPPSVVPHCYAQAMEGLKVFDHILTYDKSLCAKDPKFVYYPLGGCWILPEDRKIYSKTKNISIIASEKNFTEGHQLRHKLIQSLGNKVDVYGRGYKFIHSKLEALKDYRFTIVIENCKCDNYFSEKLIDPMVTGTMPLYWGSPGVEETFPGRGMAIFDNIPNFLGLAVIDLFREPEKYYEYCLPGIKDNFERAKQYTNTEDWLWLNILSKII